jgi:hypothetical protein
VTLRLTLAFFRFVAAVLSGLLLPFSAGAGELFGYRLQTEEFSAQKTNLSPSQKVLKMQLV